MNVVFISPQFPHTYWNFCNRLENHGVTVLGVGDTPFDWLPQEVRDSVAEYYYVGSLEDYEGVMRALGYLTWRHGKIDWIESNNEHWLALDAHLRADFNVAGPDRALVDFWQSKTAMKEGYAHAGVPSARQHVVPAGATGPDARWFAGEFAGQVGWPLFAKPQTGVGGAGTYVIHGDDELVSFLGERPQDVDYVLEEYVRGDIVSYDAIVDGEGRPVFESCMEFPASEAEVLRRQLDFVYYVRPDVPQQLRERGRACLASFGVRSRFVHLEFFRLSENRPGLGAAGDYIGLEVNMRPAGGYSPDMMNHAHACDVYQIWADVVVRGERLQPDAGNHRFCVYAARRDGRAYVHAHEDVCGRFGDRLVMCERMPESLSGVMGNQMYTALLGSLEEASEFVSCVLARPEGLPDDQLELLPAGIVIR